jgi:hypothetical protein
MWQPDPQVGMVVIKAPEVPKISHPIAIIKSRFDREDALFKRVQTAIHR